MRTQPHLNTQAIASAREEKKLSQQEMAEALDISQPAYHNIEVGKTQRLKKEQIKKISELLELPIEKILEQEQEEEENERKNIQYNQNGDTKDSTIIYTQYNEINETLLTNLIKAKDETIASKNETIALQKQTLDTLQTLLTQIGALMESLKK